MQECIVSSGNVPATAVFFILIMLLGNYMILNLFLAILLRFISSPNEDSELKNEKEEGDQGNQ
jgi:hypothetical protein